MYDYTTRVVRDTIYGSAKFHIGTGPRGSVCGAEPSCPGIWPNSGDLADFRRMCPERICKRCVNAAPAQLAIAPDASIVAEPVQAPEQRHETVKLFEPAPAQLEGQLSF